MDLQGTQNGDTLTGGADSDTIYGFGGNDTLKGLAGDDVLAGHDGADTLQGGAGDDYLLGGAGNDTLDGGDGNDWAAYEDATAGVKVDLNITGSQNTVGGGTDKLTSIENVYGSAFNDTLTGNAGDNMLVGDAGNDTITGGKGNDTLWGDAGTDVLDGGDGDDYMVGGAGDDIIKGGAGVDWSSYENATAGVTVDLNKITAQNTGGAGTDTITGVELLYGSKFDDVLTGDAKDNYLWGSDGNDKLYGGAGDDHLSGGKGVNLIDGGEGFDTVDYSFSDKGVTINLSGAPAPQIPIPDGVDTIISVEAAMGSAYNDYIVGNDAENYLFGDAGNDVIFGINGNDTLDGGDGNDVLRGSFYKPGDMLLGGAGDDQIIVWAGPGSEGLTTVDGGAGADILYFSTSSDITLNLGNTGDQVIAPGIHMVVRNIETVMGSYGNDRLTGDAGNNVINGGAGGDDILDGGAGFDVVSYENSPGVRVDLSKTGPQDTKTGGLDTLINFEGVKGSSMADILIGDAKDNTLQGSGGDDILDGGAGTDTAIFFGNASDYSWTRNANGTWTVRGLDGVDTLLNIETLKFSDKSVALSPSSTTVTVDDLMTPKVLVTSAEGFKDAILSADGRKAYVATVDGNVAGIDTVTGERLASVKVGTQLGGMALSSDGRYLVVTEGQLQDRSSPGGAQMKMATVHVLDLQTGTVKDYSTIANDHGFVDAAFMSDGKILLTQDVYVGGFAPLTTLDPTTGQFSQGDSKLYAGAGTLLATDDLKKVLMAPIMSAYGPLYMIETGKGETAYHNQNAAEDGVSTVNYGILAMSGDGALVAQLAYPNVIHIYDGALNYKLNLSQFDQNVSTVHGMTFSADGKHLYVVDAAEDRILDYSTTTWSLEEVYAIGVDITYQDFVFNAGAIYGDRVSLSDDGQHMLILDAGKVVSLNMGMLKPAGGTEGADIMEGAKGVDYLRGFGGNDTINAGYGEDTLIGGKGADKLTGGGGADTFVFAKGDTTWSTTSDAGVDVITDWEVTDKLSFGPRAQFVHYGESTATSWTAAATAAPQIIAGQNLTYLAVQVGPDVYVFAGPSTAINTGAIENVVKLANTTLDKISMENFQVVGDEFGNLLIGSDGADTINGMASADLIIGGKGTDILIGGPEKDVFQFAIGDSVATSVMTGSGVDTILDFQPGDRLKFEEDFSGTVSLAGGSAYSYVNAFETAMANLQASPGNATRISALQVGNDTFVFVGHVDSAGAHLDNVVKLTGVTSGAIQLDSFLMT